MTKKSNDKATTLAFIFGGRLANCWAQGSEDNETLANKAGKHFKRSNKHLYKFPRNQKLIVHLFDITKAEGWSMDDRDIVTCLESKEECPYIGKLEVFV